MSSLDVAIRLATQAVHQDSAKNYTEAARCYREAVVIFRTASRHPKCGKRVRAAIEDKCALYEARLRKLDRHLLSQADLTGLFRSCVEHELKSGDSHSNNRSGRSSACSEEDDRSSVDSEVLAENPFLKQGLETIERAKKEDAK